MIFKEYLPGDMFKVTFSSPKSSVLKSSMGFISCPSFFSTVDINHTTLKRYMPVTVYITRRGKKGKGRIDHRSLTLPVLLDERLEKHSPDDCIRLYGNYIRIRTERAPQNLISLNKVDFLGWASSVGDYLNLIFAAAKENKKLSDPYQTLAFQRLVKMRSEFENGNLNALNDMDDMFRINVIQAIRNAEKKAIRIIIAQKKFFCRNFGAAVSDLKSYYFKAGIAGRYLAELEALQAVYARDGAEKAIKLIT